jgi:carbon storage regulator
MLVLSRKEGEAIVVGDEIEITVSSVRGGKVRLAISAPDDVVIMRREVLERLGGCLLVSTRPHAGLGRSQPSGIGDAKIHQLVTSKGS